ncbi:MAG: VTT domain-containing protein [Pseudomonadota bacterium]
MTSLALGGLILWFSPLNNIDSNQLADDLGKQLSALDNAGLVLTLLGGTLATAVGIPRQLIALICGFGFGLAVGLPLAITACSLGAITTFLASRHLARDWVARRFPKIADTLTRFAADDAFLKILIIRFLPIGTNMLTNLAAGTTHIKARTFFLASMLGFLPQTSIFVLIGNGLKVRSTDQLLLAGVLTVIALILSAWLYRKHRASLSPDAT